LELSLSGSCLAKIAVILDEPLIWLKPRVSIVKTNNSKKAVWIWCLVVGLNDRFGDISCNAATDMIRMREIYVRAKAAPAQVRKSRTADLNANRSESPQSALHDPSRTSFSQ
jgi:hypothetical protein